MYIRQKRVMSWYSRVSIKLRELKHPFLFERMLIMLPPQKKELQEVFSFSMCFPCCSVVFIIPAMQLFEKGFFMSISTLKTQTNL